MGVSEKDVTTSLTSLTAKEVSERCDVRSQPAMADFEDGRRNLSQGYWWTLEDGEDQSKASPPKPLAMMRPCWLLGLGPVGFVSASHLPERV